MRSLKLYSLAVLFFGLLHSVSSITLVPSGTKNVGQDSVVSVKDLSDESDDFWTPEKLESVKPMPLPILVETSDLSKEVNKYDRRKRSNAQINGKDGNDLQGIKPAPMPHLKLSDIENLGIEPNLRTLAKGSRRTEHSIVEPADITQPPYNTMGKLLFQDVEGETYECTGQYIAPNIVLTAAHCVYNIDSDPPAWNRHFRFIQQFEKKRSTTKYSGTPRKVLKAVVNNQWMLGSRSPFAFDFAMLAMAEPTTSGYVEIGYPEDFDTWTAAGFPENYANGKVLHVFKGEKGRMTRSVVETSRDPMGPGCSGGAWLAETGGKTYVVGLNSFSIEGVTSMFSPRFTKDHINLVLGRVGNELAKSNGNLEFTRD